MLMYLAIVWLACAAIFLCMADKAPVLTRKQHD